MTRPEIATMIELMANELGCEFAYHHFDEKQKPTMPFLIFEYPSATDIFADDINYVGKEPLNIFYCSRNPNFDHENIIKDILATNRIPCVVNRLWIDRERMYQTTFESEVLING